MTTFYNREGRRIPMARWAALFADDSYRLLAIEGPIDFTIISTIWVGFDQRLLSPLPDLAPLIFETAVFHGQEIVEVLRWATETQALAGHHSVSVRVFGNRRR